MAMGNGVNGDGSGAQEEVASLNGPEGQTSKGDEKANTVPFLKLFSFADETDILLMIQLCWCCWEWTFYASHDYLVRTADRFFWEEPGQWKCSPCCLQAVRYVLSIACICVSRNQAQC